MYYHPATHGGVPECIGAVTDPVGVTSFAGDRREVFRCLPRHGEDKQAGAKGAGTCTRYATLDVCKRVPPSFCRGPGGDPSVCLANCSGSSSLTKRDTGQTVTVDPLVEFFFLTPRVATDYGDENPRPSEWANARVTAVQNLRARTGSPLSGPACRLAGRSGSEASTAAGRCQ
jgi:hypothetical protein